jgi:hypothetical protein
MIKSEKLITIETIPFINDIDRVKKTRELRNCRITRKCEKPTPSGVGWIAQ